MGKRNYQFHRSELFRRLGWLVVPVLFWQLDTLGNLSIASIQESNNSTCQDCCDYWCTTMNCVKEAAQLWQLMNHSADPCVNFDEFACGKFYKEADIPDERGYAESWDISNEKIRKILEEILSEEIKPKDRHHQRMRKLFMKSCMDIEQRERIGLQPFLETKFAEEWPTLKGRAWKETKNFSLEEMVLLYSRFNPFFNIHVVEDHENLPHKAIDITPLETGFLDSFQYQRGRHSNLVMAYETKLREMAVELGADPVTAAQDAAAFVDWQAQFFKGKNFFLIDIMEFNLSSLYSNSNLSRLGVPQAISALFGSVNITLGDNVQIIVYDRRVFNKIKVAIEKMTEREIRNVFGFTYAATRVFVTKRMQEISDKLEEVQTGNSFKKPLIRRCVEAVSNHFSLSLSKEYVNSAISNTAKNALAEMYERTKEIFREILNNTSWMARSSKQAALDKLESIALINVLPEEGFDDDSLDMVYKNFVMSGENYYENIETSIREAEMKNLRSLKDPSEDAT
ncbi:hypothetical protein RRG08_005188 [Elysia crispata]|nr:hypothetical protein RRG08_005188 [Elysia crispata]